MNIQMSWGNIFRQTTQQTSSRYGEELIDITEDDHCQLWRAIVIADEAEARRQRRRRAIVISLHGDGRHDDGNRRYGNGRHDDGDGRHDDGRHDDCDGQHDNGHYDD